MEDAAPEPDEDAQTELRRQRLDFLTWERTTEDIDSPAHRSRLQRLEAYAGARFGSGVYVAEHAQVHTSRLIVGSGSWIAGHALVRGDIDMGDNVSVNPYACLSGKIRIGNGVRIASHVSIVGFNHGIDDLETPIYRQSLTSIGIDIGDDVWIGANAVLLDGVRIGHGSVIAAGAVVSRDIPPMSIAAGVPARVLRSRLPATIPAKDPPNSQVAETLATLGRRAAQEWRAVIDHHRDGTGFVSPEASGARVRTVRHLCDVVEIAAAFDGIEGVIDRHATIIALQSLQDLETGLFPEPGRAATTPLKADGTALYNTLAASYALDCLGAAPLHPVHIVEDLSDQDFTAWLENLPWLTRAWHCGATVDAIATSLHLNRRHFRLGHKRHALFGWLTATCNPQTGLWGSATRDEGLLQPVNGFYRLTRGAYAQFGLPVPYPEAAIGAVLQNHQDYRGFAGRDFNACNLLDTIHPLLLCRQQTPHRQAEAAGIAEHTILRLADFWQQNRGFAFAEGQEPGLQGTEMWLSVLWLAAETLGLSHTLPFVPKGIHRWTKPHSRKNDDRRDERHAPVGPEP